jgi:hypothetical protein
MSTISTSGIAPSSVIRAEHVLRVINALSNNANNDILISGSLTVTGSTALSGSLDVTGGITGSIFGTSSNSISSSYALTASYAVSASYEISYEVSSSYAESATSASYALSSSYALNSTSASYSLSSSYALNSTNATNATSASYSLDSTNAATATSASYALDSTNSSAATSASYALTASYALNSPGGGGTTDTGSLLLTASVTDNVITFTKGDASTFNITIDTGSASSIDTGSFATTGSNQFSGSQGITGSVDLNGGTFTTLGGSSLMSVYSNIITIENQGSPFDTTLLGQGTLSYSSGSNSQQFLFPASLSTGIKAITLPNDTGTVALTYNTATTGSNIFSGSQTITGSLNNGLGNTITGLNSHAEGQLTVASGSYSHAEGYKSVAVGQYSHAEGGAPAGIFIEQLGGRAVGSGSHAEGSFTLASGSFSHAEGYFTTASAPWSHAEGLGTIANGWYQHVQGAYNVPSSEQGAFIVGNGVDDTVRSNLIVASGELVQVTGSVSITNVLTLTPNDPLPTSQPTGSISVSGSGVDCKPYFYNGTDWTSLI